MIQEFREFAMRGNVVDLAVGFILGGAFSTIVKSLVDDVLMPPLGLVLGGVDFQNLFIALDGGAYASLAEAQAAGAATLNYGLFINNVIAFVILAAALFFLVKGMNRLQRTKQAETDIPPQEMPPVKPRQEELLEEIRDALRAGPQRGTDA